MTQEQKLKIYAAYLPYGLKVIYGYDRTVKKEGFLRGYDVRYGFQVFNPRLVFGHEFVNPDLVKPVLYSMDWLTKEIVHEGETFVPIDKIRNLDIGYVDWITVEREAWIERYGRKWWLGRIPYVMVQLLLSWHFNIFSLPETDYIKKEN